MRFYLPVKLLGSPDVPYLGCFKTSSAYKTTSENFLVTQDTVVGILILVQKLLKLIALLACGRHLRKIRVEQYSAGVA